jgi:hypothetical protein
MDGVGSPFLCELAEEEKIRGEGPIYSALFFFTILLLPCRLPVVFLALSYGGFDAVRVRARGPTSCACEQQIPVAWTATGRHRGLKKPDGVKGCRRRRISYDTQAKIRKTRVKTEQEKQGCKKTTCQNKKNKGCGFPTVSFLFLFLLGFDPCFSYFGMQASVQSSDELVHRVKP